MSATEIALGAARQAIAAARALVRRQQAAPRQPLQHLRHQLDGNVVLLGDLARARRRQIGARGEVLHRHQRVVGFLGESQHNRSFTRARVAASRRRTSGPSSTRVPTRHRLSRRTRLAHAFTFDSTSDGSDCAAGQPGRRQRHGDERDARRVDGDVVNQPELPDVDRDLRIEHRRDRLR